MQVIVSTRLFDKSPARAFYRMALSKPRIRRLLASCKVNSYRMPCGLASSGSITQALIFTQYCVPPNPDVRSVEIKKDG
jgi:hypothetical protein